jgi:hypothetical protein
VNRGCDLVTPRLSAATVAALRQLGEVHRHLPRLVARQPIWSPSGATQRYVRIGREAEARGLRLNDVDDPKPTSPRIVN